MQVVVSKKGPHGFRTQARYLNSGAGPACMGGGGGVVYSMVQNILVSWVESMTMGQTSIRSAPQWYSESHGVVK